MNQTGTNRYRQERDFLIYVARTGTKTKERSTGITPSDYATVYTPPANNHAPTYGPCLIWRRGLNAKGYGLAWQNGRQMLAHRAVYEITRGSIPENKHILHMCNRRSCIQPAHLYAGTPQENADDRKAKTENMIITESMFEKHNRLVKDCAQYVWPEPPYTQLSHLPEPEHKCNFVIPAGESKLCEVCYQPLPGTSLWWALRELSGDIDHQQQEQQYRQQYLDMTRQFSNSPS